MKKTIVISGFILLLSAGIFMLRKPPVQAITSVSQQTEPHARITIGGKSLAELPTASQKIIEDKPILSAQLASDLKWNQISKIQHRGNQDILVFNDGSQLHVTDYVEKQLPHHIQYRLDYSLEGGAPARHGY